jgi:hypothetical protein
MSILANHRARSATEIVDASAQFCRAHAIPLATIAAVVIVPPAVVGAFVSEGVAIVVNLIGNLLLGIGGGATSLYAVAVMTEGDATVGGAFSKVSRHSGRIIAAQIVYGFAIIVGAVLLVVPGLIFAVRYGLATTIAAVEGADSSLSLKRSWALTKGHGMHAFRTMVIGFGIAFLVVVGGGIVLGIAAESMGLPDSTTNLVATPLMVVTAPFVWVVATLLYIDVRVRVEGADIEAMVAELPRPAVGTPTR